MIIITINQDKLSLCADGVASTVPNTDMNTVFIKKKKKDNNL